MYMIDHVDMTQRLNCAAPSLGNNTVVHCKAAGAATEKHISPLS